METMFLLMLLLLPLLKGASSTKPAFDLPKAPIPPTPSTTAEQPDIFILAPGTTTSNASSDPDETKNGVPGHRPSMLLIFFHGAFVSPDRYIGFCRAIQNAAFPFADIYVGLCSFTIAAGAVPEETEPNINKVIEMANEELRTFSSSSSAQFDTTFIAAHSAAVYETLRAALPPGFDGAVLIGGTSNSRGIYPPPTPSRMLSSYPRPVLTAIGERDGCIRSWQLAGELDLLDRYADDAGLDDRARERLTLHKPILVLNEVNHMQVGDGIIGEKAAAAGRSDLDSDINLEEAWARVGDSIADFLVFHTTGSRLHRESLLRQSHESRETLETYRALTKPSYMHSFAQRLQRDLLQISEKEGPGDNICVQSHWHETKEDFLYSKPTVLQDSNCTVVNIHVVEQTSLELTKPAQLTPTLAIQFKSREGLIAKLGEDERKVLEASPLTCPPPSLADINRLTFNEVLNNQVTSQQRDRYFTRGRPLEFLPDILIKSSPEWVDTPIEFTFNERAAYLRSPYATTPPDLQPPKFAGMWYGKPLTPAQAYEYIVFDAFKKLPATKSKDSSSA